MPGAPDFFNQTIGSVETKVDAVLVAVGKLPLSAAVAASFSTNDAVLQTALNLAGSGRLKALAVKNSESAAGSHAVVKITVDGVVWGWGKCNPSSTAYQYLDWFRLLAMAQDGSQLLMSSPAAEGLSPVVNIPFASSLKLELRSSAASNTPVLYWQVDKAV